MYDDAYHAVMQAVVGERGQVTIPKPLRERLGIRPGQRLTFAEERGRLVAEKADVDDPVSRVYGILRVAGWDTDSMIEAMRGPADLPPDDRG